MNAQTLVTPVAVAAIISILPGQIPAQSAQLVAIKPSLNNGVLCVARVTTAKTRTSFYTSTIDYTTMKKGGQTVSVTINQAPAASPNVETQPIANVTASYIGNNSYAGKTGNGKPLSFSLTPDLSQITVNYGGMTANGSCN